MTAATRAGPRTTTVASAAVDFAAALARRARPKPLLFGLAIVALAVSFSALFAPIIGAKPSTATARLVSHVVTAISVLIAVVIADEAVDRGAPRLPAYAIAVIGGALFGALAGWPLRESLGLRFGFEGSVPAAAVTQFSVFHRLDQLLMGVLLGGVATFVHANRRTALAARRRQHDAERARARAQRRTLESQLQALQARVEPMFLFDTLERVRTLYRVDAAAAGAMLEDLIVYLRAALPHLRESTSTLDQEITLVRSWFDIVGRAAPDRRFERVVDDALHSAAMPALVLLPLVQHAVGDAASKTLRLRMCATIVDGRLRIEISTSTPAFARGGSGRATLGQIAERLQALYGEHARTGGGRLDDAPFASQAWIEWPFEAGDRLAAAAS